MRDTAALLGRLPLDRRDLVLFSPYQETRPDVRLSDFRPNLDAAACAAQRREIVRAWCGGRSAPPARTAVYSLEEFIY